MWRGAACPLVADLLPHFTHDFHSKIFLVEDGVVYFGRIGIVVANFRTSEVFNPQGIPDIGRDYAPETHSSRTPNTGGVGICPPDSNVLRQPELGVSHAQTSNGPCSQKRVPGHWIFPSQLKLN